jgi:hypothetical protein
MEHLQERDKNLRDFLAGEATALAGSKRQSFREPVYVSITGVIAYLMCYRWYGPPLGQ